MKKSLHKITMFTALLKDIDCSADRSLFINCGGGSAPFNDDTYEADLTNGGPVAFSFLPGKWGYSSTGTYMENNSVQTYIAKNDFNLGVKGVLIFGSLIKNVFLLF